MTAIMTAKDEMSERQERICNWFVLMDFPDGFDGIACRAAAFKLLEDLPGWQCGNASTAPRQYTPGRGNVSRSQGNREPGLHQRVVGAYLIYIQMRD
jgi:hypothetical protein